MLTTVCKVVYLRTYLGYRGFYEASSLLDELSLGRLDQHMGETGPYTYIVQLEWAGSNQRRDLQP